MAQPCKSKQGIRLVRETVLQHDVTAFLVDRAARGLAQGTLEYYRKKLTYLQTYLESRGVDDVQDVTPDLLRHYLVDLSQRLNPGGVHCCFRAMRSFLRWYEAEYEPQGWVNPMRKIRAPRLTQKALDPLPLSDLKAMLATCQRRTWAGDRDRGVLLGLLDTGTRASEFVALDVDDVNVSTGSVIIRKGKGGKTRVAFLGAATRREVLRWLRFRGEGPGALWTTRAGARLTYAGLRQVVRRRALAAGVAVPSLHSFRRTFALMCLRAGMNVFALQRLLGHGDLSVLRRYLAQTEGDLQAAHRAAGPVDGLLQVHRK
jgi:integrase/recombinase XerD